MATAFIQPPPHFDPGSKPALAWEEWRSAYELYEEACGYDTKEPGPRRALLLHALGPAARKIYKGFVFPPPTDSRPKETSLEILNKFEDLYKPYKNIIHSSAIFNSIVQKPNQTIDELVAELKGIAIDCDYGDKCDRLIGDRLILGIQDLALKERLLRESSLSLDKIINLCKSAEISKEQAKSLQAPSATFDSAVDTICQQPKREVKQFYGNTNHVRYSQHTNKNFSDKFKGKTGIPTGRSRCSRCDTNHPPRNCPAYGTNCFKCGTFGHFARVCRKISYSNRQVAALRGESSDSENELLFIGELTTNNLKRSTKWNQSIRVNGYEVIFKIDTGSEVNLIPEKIFANWSNKPCITPPTTTVITYNKDKLLILGECKLKCTTSVASEEFNFSIVSENLKPILGADASENLGLVTRNIPPGVSTITKEVLNDSPQQIVATFKDVFSGTGKLPGQYHITLQPDSIPKIVAPRKIPIALQQKVKNELQRLEKNNVIVKVKEPTEWVHPLAISIKKGGGIRLCLDPRQLNKAIRREHYRIPTQEELFARIKGCKLFTLFDASDAFWQLELDTYSSKLCTFATPWGRYRFLRMPFGLSCAPEMFQRAMDEIFQGESKLILYFDDILIASKNEAEQSNLIFRLLTIARESGLKLNKNKVRLGLNKITFLGHTLSEKGIAPDPEKINSILSLKSPANTIELMRFLGMITYLTKFIPNFSQHTSQLRALLKPATPWVWDANLENEFQLVKHLLTTAPVLAYFDQKIPIVISTDSSFFGIGSVLLQNDHPVAYASASLTPTQQRWAQIEKELLAIVFACEKFHYFVYGHNIEVQTDHKPLLGLLDKPLELITPRLQRLILRLQRYNVTLTYVPGKFLNVADTLSRAPISEFTTQTLHIDDDVTVCSLAIVTTPKLNELKVQTRSDPTLQKVATYITNGCPNLRNIKDHDVRQHLRWLDELHMVDGLICRGQRIVIPKVAQKDILQRLHEDHRGLAATKTRARESLYWPTMNNDIHLMISQCITCQKFQNNNQREPLEDRTLPSRPWQMVAADFFHLNGKNFLLIIDYFSKYVEVLPMVDTTAKSVILSFKSVFSRFGIPEEIVTDNGPPFDSECFKSFLLQWDINHNPSAPYNPRSNGQAERTIQTLKKSLLKAANDGKDLYLVLMNYRNTPSHGLKSPAELLMGRKIRTLVPTLPTNLKPNYNTVDTKHQLKNHQSTQHRYSDKHTKLLKPLGEDQPVWFALGKTWLPGTIVQIGPQKRSYKIKGQHGKMYRRNRFHVKPRTLSNSSYTQKENIVPPSIPEDYYSLNEPPQPAPKPQNMEVPLAQQTLTTRYGRKIVRPLRYKD